MATFTTRIAKMSPELLLLSILIFSTKCQTRNYRFANFINSFTMSAKVTTYICRSKFSPKLKIIWLMPFLEHDILFWKNLTNKYINYSTKIQTHLWTNQLYVIDLACNHSMEILKQVLILNWVGVWVWINELCRHKTSGCLNFHWNG